MGPPLKILERRKCPTPTTRCSISFSMNIVPLSFLLHSTTNTNQAKQSTKEEMVSSSSPLLPSDEETTVNPNCGSDKNQFISSCCILLSSAFHQTPLHPAPSAVRSHSKTPNPNNIIIIQDLQRSLLSTADTCLKNFNSFAASNPFFRKLFSISQNFQNFCEIRRRNCSSSSSLSVHNFAAILPGDSVAGLVVANGVSNFLNLYNTLIVVRLVLTWFPNSPPAIVGPLSTICDPYLNIFRGLIPPLGGTLDLSPILAFLVLNALTSTASALPAELPDKVMASEDLSPSHQSFFNLTTMQKKWMRFSGNRSLKNSGSHN